MSADVGKDPLFRSQYECGVPEDREVEEALGGPHAPRLSMPPVREPLAPATIQPFVRLR